MFYSSVQHGGTRGLMLKIYTRQQYLTVGNDGASIPLCGYSGAIMMDEAELQEATTPKTFDNAAELYEFLSEHHLPGLYNDWHYRLFRKPIPCIKCHRRDDFVLRISTDDKRSFTYHVKYSRFDGLTLDAIMKRFSAGKVLQYLKERGMAVCPLTPEMKG